MAHDDLFVRFWGVRGSIPSPGQYTSRYGGNTSCVEVRCGDRLLVFDAGSGARKLGNMLTELNETGSVDLFFTHCHYDHIEGLPFFAPLHAPGWTIQMWSGHLQPPMNTASMVARFMERPYFPIGPNYFRAKVNYHDFRPGDTLQAGDDVVLRTTPLNHPDGAVGYRVDYKGKSFCYVTDTEHLPGTPDENIMNLIHGADVVVYDAAYCDETFERYKGYGHSTWQEGVRLCKACKVGQLVIFHHRPGQRDEALDELAQEVDRVLPGSILAREGLELYPGR